MELGLCTKPEPWIDLFQCRDFSAAMEIHSSFDRQQCVWFKDTLAPPPESQFMRTFGSVVFDISCLQECVTPLDKLQLLISALRKATSVLSELRMKQMLSNSECWKWASFRTCILPFSLLSIHSFVVISCSFPAHFLLISCPTDTYDLSNAAVSGDDLLPLLVLVLLQLHPSFLAHLHLQCCLLDDYMAPFLSLGWHGYSLVTFQSAIKAIADMHDT